MTHAKCRTDVLEADAAGRPSGRVKRRVSAALAAGLGAALALLSAASASVPMGVPEARYLVAGALGESAANEVVFDLSVTGESASFGVLGADPVVGRVEGEGVLMAVLPEGMLELNLPSFWTPTPEVFPGTLDGLPVRLEKRAEYAFELVRQGAYTEVAASYPVFGAPWRGVNGRVQASVKVPMMRALEKARALSRRGQLGYPWTLEETLEPTYYSPRVLSLLGTGSVYTGGAHPNTFYRALTFERVAGVGVRELALRDLFRAAYADTLLTEVDRKLRAWGAAWIVDGSVVLQEADLNVFTLTRRGLRFAFAPYAVGPYAQGAFFVTVPYELLSDALHPRFLP